MLSTLILLPLIGSFLLLFVPARHEKVIKSSSFLISGLVFILSVNMWLEFDTQTDDFQFIEVYSLLDHFNVQILLGVDGISLFFILLTTLLIPICISASWDAIKVRVKEYMIAFLLLEAMVIAVFCSLDLILFYILFESVLLPMFVVIGVWGSRARKIRAAYMFFLYTLLGSVLMLLAVIWIYVNVGTANYQILLSGSAFDPTVEKLLWLAFFASFASKVPMVPVHIWLPEAHVEAPTAGSVILAGILLKLGTYGILRFSIPLFPNATLYFTPLVYTIALIGIVYTSLTAIRQTDLKRIIAYSSVAHMNLVIVGLFSMNTQGIEGAILQQLSHGLVSGALFLCIGVIYDRHHTRLVKYYSGLAHTMPIYITIFMFFTMANIALPGTSSFVGEFLILAGSFQVSTSVCFFAATGMILGGCYSLWLFNRVAFGNIKNLYISAYSDMNLREFLTLLPLIILTLVMGLYPEIFLGPMHTPVASLIEYVHTCVGK